MDQLLMEIQAQAFKILGTILVIFVGYVSKHAVQLLKSKGILAKLEHNKGLVKIVVSSINQVYKEMDGETKLGLAKEQLLKILADKKINISSIELDHTIEAVVKELKDSVKKEVSVPPVQ